MTCANKVYASRAVVPHPINIWMGPAAVAKAIVTIIDAFHDAMELRRAAHRRFPLIEE